MPHQQAMVLRMLNVEKELIGKQGNASYAMMSDKPGAGKTYAVLAMLYVTNKIIFKNTKTHVNLVVVPYNICTQWSDSMAKLYGPSGVLMDYKILTEYSDMMSLYVNPALLLKYDVLLTTSLYFDMICNTLKSLKLKIQRVFFDEADTIQNLLAKQLDCNMTWFISASIRSIFNGSNSVSIGNYSLEMSKLEENNVQCDSDFVNENIVLESPKTHYIECRSVYRDLLLLLASHKYHSDINAMDYRFFRFEHFSNGIIKTPYDACCLLLKDAVKREEYSLGKIEELTTAMELALARDKNELAGECQSQINTHTNILAECSRVLGVFNTFKETHNVEDFIYSAPLHPNENKLKLVQDTIIRIMQNPQKPSTQLLIFTNHDAIFTELRPFLRTHSISYIDLDGGNVVLMDKIIGRYKSKEFDVLLANSSMYSCGMNLENTNDILFVHSMDVHRESQVIGRAHRYGRQGTLDIWYVEYTQCQNA